MHQENTDDSECTWDDRPDDPEWRANALARSHHSRLLDELRAPTESFDQPAATRLCAEICRNVLGDLAPCLLLLPAPERLRTQVVTAFATTLFDFARQRGLEGDRLAEINRWEFRCEEALSDTPAGEPVFLLLSQEHKRQAWPADAIDGLFAAARRQATGRRAAGNESQDLTLARSLTLALTGVSPPVDVAELGASILRLQRSLDGNLSTDKPSQVDLEYLTALRPHGLPSPWKHAARFLQLAGSRQLEALISSKDSDKSKVTPTLGLGLWARLALLTRARLTAR